MAGAEDFLNFPDSISTSILPHQPLLRQLPATRPRPDRENSKSAQLHEAAIMIYSAIFRNNFTMLTAVFTAGFAFEIGFNQTMNKIWDNNNRGRQWKDIRHKYVEETEDDE
ncbi:hypothetical protein LMH87_011510 [Akanthomyces muscarius]|uniref:Complex III subunit 9 n=1 Tax=Akanthomyces muscarius TaxID=2231603 RepID=A0A9W8Q9V7_AKAMU|nr:hypothetical protein LMH87_011510 [Akanthomyces muscarius]KAJ4150775.1 hypothetical protein LMH87_011510 [Akanthomyces muscarius]